MSVPCDRSVIFSWYSGFLHQSNLPPRYNWNIVESGVKHHKPNPWSCDILFGIWNCLDTCPERINYSTRLEYITIERVCVCYNLKSQQMWAKLTYKWFRVELGLQTVPTYLYFSNSNSIYNREITQKMNWLNYIQYKNSKSTDGIRREDKLSNLYI